MRTDMWMREGYFDEAAIFKLQWDPGVIIYLLAADRPTEHIFCRLPGEPTVGSKYN